ncbi:MAG TPA: hypothetical protein VND45_03040 [Thermoanaerobaculia bacterium]|nr:hypothetical protein [Thermoanaerobaculia bacterium]
MKIVRGRADARWLPSRFNFALFRLLAYLRMRGATPEPRDVSLIVDPNQNNLESHLLAAWTTLTVTCYAAGTLFEEWPLPLALLAGVPVAITCLEIPIILVGLSLRRSENNIGLNSVLLMALLIVAALYFARAHSWIRFAAWQFLAGVALNALAAPVAFLLRGHITEMENAVGGISSEL